MYAFMNNFRLRLLNRFLVVLLPILVSSFSLPRTVEKMGIEKGLSDNYVLAIAQDNDGFMWFGTEWGLNRFDGRSFRSYKTHSSDGNTVSSNGINKIWCDKEKNVLWIATKSGGLNKFDCSTQQFIHYPVVSDAPNSTRSKGITDLCLATDGNLWIATYQDGIKKLDRKTDRIRHLSTLGIPLLRDYKVWCVADDGKGNLYIGYLDKGLAVFSVKDHSIKHYMYNPHNPDGLPDNEVLDLCVDSQGNVWLGTHAGLVLYHPETERFTVFRQEPGNPDGLADNDVHSVAEIDHTLWIGTWSGGVSLLDLGESTYVPGKVQFRSIRPSDFPTGLSIPSVVETFRDSFGNIWIGTYGGGINFIAHKSSFFNTFSYSPLKGDENGLSGKSATSICYDRENRLWVGTGNEGIDVYRDGKKMHHYSKENNTLPDNSILSALADSKGNVWFGTDRNGVIRWNAQKNSFEKMELSKHLPMHRHVTCLYEDRAGIIWVGTNDGILLYNPVNGEVRELSGKELHLPNNLIRSICQDVNGNFWIGGWMDGISVITPQCKWIRSFTSSNGLPSDNINLISRDSDGRMWIASVGGLIFFPRLLSRDYTFEVWNQKKGLPDNYIRAVAEGTSGDIWITTNAGISRYSLEDRKIENYGYHDGIPWGTFMSAVVKAPDGTIYFGGQGGVCYFNSSSNNVLSYTKSTIPSTVITHFSVYDTKGIQPNNSSDIPVASPIRLEYDQNTFTIGFNVLDYALKDQVEYVYSLKGVDDLWYQTNGQNEVTFRNLSPGTYIFSVRSRLRNQGWSSDSVSLKIEIAPPFWGAVWAKIVYLLCGILVIVAIVRFYKRRLNLENQLYLEKQNHLQEQKLNEEKLRFYTNVAHELRTPLTLVIGPLEDLMADQAVQPKQMKKVSLIHKSAVRLLNLINQIMEFRKSDTCNRRLKVVRGDLSELVQEIVLKYKGLNSNVQVSVDLFFEAYPHMYYDREVMTIILDNLISNSLKYTQEGTISVILREVPRESVLYVEIEVHDTGTGIPEEALGRVFERYYQVGGSRQASGTGIGLALVKSLVELHEGEIEVRSKMNEGTSFYVRFRMDASYPHALHVEQEEKTDSQKKKDSLPVLLVVEDHEDICDYIADSFSDSFEVLTAREGREGVELATERIPDLIISDIMMPVMDGMELCKILKEDMRTSHIPIILLTAKDSEQDKTEGYSIGADSYITKPFSANLLKKRVENLLKGRERIANYFSTHTYKKVLLSDALGRLDQEFVEKTIAMIKKYMESEQISVAFLAEQLHMSYSTFSRKIKALTGMTVNELVRKVKMQHAEQLLLSGRYTVSEVIFKVGYSSMAYFREAFKAEFGILPSDYMKNTGKSADDPKGKE